MEAHTDIRTAARTTDKNLLADYYDAAANAAEGTDATATANLNRVRAWERAMYVMGRPGFSAAMNAKAGREAFETLDALAFPGANAPRFRGRAFAPTLRRLAAHLRE